MHYDQKQLAVYKIGSSLNFRSVPYILPEVHYLLKINGFFRPVFTPLDITLNGWFSARNKWSAKINLWFPTLSA